MKNRKKWKDLSGDEIEDRLAGIWQNCTLWISGLSLGGLFLVLAYRTSLHYFNWGW